MTGLPPIVPSSVDTMGYKFSQDSLLCSRGGDASFLAGFLTAGDGSETHLVSCCFYGPDFLIFSTFSAIKIVFGGGFEGAWSDFLFGFVGLLSKGGSVFVFSPLFSVPFTSLALARAKAFVYSFRSFARSRFVGLSLSKRYRFCPVFYYLVSATSVSSLCRASKSRPVALASACCRQSSF